MATAVSRVQVDIADLADYQGIVDLKVFQGLVEYLGHQALADKAAIVEFLGIQEHQGIVDK